MSDQQPAPPSHCLATGEWPSRGDPGTLQAGRRFDAEALRQFTIACLVATGVVVEEAAIVAESLIDASLRGVDTHGVATAFPAPLDAAAAGGSA